MTLSLKHFPFIFSNVQLFVIPRIVAARLLHPRDSSGKNTAVGFHALLQGIFLTQGSNPHLLPGRQILNHLSHQGHPLSSVQLLSRVRLFATPWITARQASLSITNSQSLLKLTSIESVIPSNHLILCRPLLLLPSIFPSIRVFSNESVLQIKWPKYWHFSFSISPFNEYSGLISLRIDWFDSSVKKLKETIMCVPWVEQGPCPQGRTAVA